MKQIIGFLRATLIGDLVFVVPLVVLVLLIREAVQITAETLRPVTQLVPTESMVGVVVADLVALLAIVGLCFLAGLFVGTRSGRYVTERMEQAVLGRVPGFSFLKSITRGMAGLETGSELAVALARIEDAWMWAFVVERHRNGLFTVFVPSAPTPATGSVYFLPPERVKLVNVPVSAAVKCILSLGAGSRDLLEDTIPAVSTAPVAGPPR